MMKKLTALVLTLALCLTAALAVAETDKTYTIGIAQFAEHSSLDNCREGFIQGLAEMGYVEGENVTFIVQNAQADMGLCQQIAQQMAQECDLVCAIATPMAQASQASKAEVAQWRAVVQACVPALVAAWEPIMGVKAGQLAYRNMTSRWGSCQPSTGRICINVRLALYPPECLEYVVVHELCHLLERGHGPRFHQLMDRFMPDWKQRRDKLR